MKHYDRWGHDIITGERLYTERVIEGEVKRVPTPELTHATYLLDDGSLMRVCVSKKSKEGLTNSVAEKKDIMSKVIEGWKRETEQQVKDGSMKKEDATSYLQEYGKKTIFDRIDDIPYGSLANLDAEVLKVKKRMLKMIRKDSE